jgi:hypothetical protein
MRKVDVSGTSGVGVVAEGVVFDNGKAAMTWLSDVKSVTCFDRLTEVIKIHGHGGATVMVLEGRKSDAKAFESCLDAVRARKAKAKHAGVI